MNILSISQQQAEILLEGAGGDLETAIQLATDSQDTVQHDRYVAPPKEPETKPTSSVQLPTQVPPQKKPTTQPRSGITGLQDISPDKEESKDKKDLSWFTGGASSGLAVQAPQQANNTDVVNNLFDTAKRQGAISKSDEKSPEKEKFAGSGFVLGNTDRQSAVVTAAPAKQHPRRVIVTFYKDCFTVDDGPPRKITEPVNRTFLDDISNGRIPRELTQLYGSAVIDVELIDKKGEDYNPPPKPAIVSFSGAGHTLGGPQTANMVSAKGKKIVVDESAPTTTVQVRTHNGQRLLIKANHNHTVGDLRSHIEMECPTGKSFELRTTYPPQVLTDDSETLKDAGLLNAAIVQRI